MRSNIVREILDNTPLETKLYVSTEMFLIHAITELGYRENKSWNEEDSEDNRVIKKIAELSRWQAEHLQKEIAQHVEKTYTKKEVLEIMDRVLNKMMIK